VIRVMKYILLAVVIFSVMLTAGCGTNSAENKSAESQTSSTEQKATEQTPDQAKEEAIVGVSKENPLKVDKSAGTVTFLAQVNGKYFYDSTRHGAAFGGGSNGEKAIFRGLAEPEPFYNGLLEIGAKAGNNMTMENKDKTNVAGDALDVTVTWAGAAKDYKFDEVVKESNGQPIDIHFGGNLKNAQDKKTGCLICLDSCPVGVTSNANYTYGAVETRKEVGFTGNKDLLPADGTLVAVTLKIKK